MKKLFLVGVFLAGFAMLFAADFNVEVNTSDGVYHPDNKLEVTLKSDTVCYFQIKLVDSKKNEQILYPVVPSDNAQLNANEVRTVPSSDEESIEFEGESYGKETIVVTFSKNPVPQGKIAKADILATRQVSYSYEPYKMVQEFMYPAEVLKSIKDEVSAAGGKVSGDAKKGTFETPVMTITYEIKGNQLAFFFPKDPALLVAPVTRGKPQKPINIPLVIPSSEIPKKFDSASKEFTKVGGKLSGDMTGGSFDAPMYGGVNGQYNVNGENVTITVSKYPGFAPESMVVSTVKEKFK
ncbi:MAG: hypothetical protein Ta2B_08720 [Termitinemataceae bacterium]|nr:MAG: hypothetical protein Ta2B_08720 [Termitinemataceae bacterium]